MAEDFFLLIFGKFYLFSSVEIRMNDGERHFFVCHQKKCSILGKEENSVLLSSVNETSEKVSLTHIVLEEIFHIFGGTGQVCIGLGTKMSQLSTTSLETSLE